MGWKHITALQKFEIFIFSLTFQKNHNLLKNYMKSRHPSCSSPSPPTTAPGQPNAQQSKAEVPGIPHPPPPIPAKHTHLWPLTLELLHLNNIVQYSLPRKSSLCKATSEKLIRLQA